MEDALISPISFSILSGAGLIDASKDAPVFQHMTETTDRVELSEAGDITITLENVPIDSCDFASGDVGTPNPWASATNANEDWIYVMILDSDGDADGEPFIASRVLATAQTDSTFNAEQETARQIVIKKDTVDGLNGRTGENRDGYKAVDLAASIADGATVIVDYYVAQTGNAQQIEITADKFGGNYYLEASTLFRNRSGVDMPAEFIIPNCKIQSNFTFTMASSGDPSTFTFTMDAFPDYTRFDSTKRVLAAIQIMSDTGSGEALRRISTKSQDDEDSNGIIIAGDDVLADSVGG